MSDLKERLIKEFKDLYDKDYQVFNKFIEDKIIENHGAYIMVIIYFIHYISTMIFNYFIFYEFIKYLIVFII